MAALIEDRWSRVSSRGVIFGRPSENGSPLYATYSSTGRVKRGDSCWTFHTKQSCWSLITPGVLWMAVKYVLEISLRARERHTGVEDAVLDRKSSPNNVPSSLRERCGFFGATEQAWTGATSSSFTAARRMGARGIIILLEEHLGLFSDRSLSHRVASQLLLPCVIEGRVGARGCCWHKALSDTSSMLSLCSERLSSKKKEVRGEVDLIVAFLAEGFWKWDWHGTACVAILKTNKRLLLVDGTTSRMSKSAIDTITVPTEMTLRHIWHNAIRF